MHQKMLYDPELPVQPTTHFLCFSLRKNVHSWKIYFQVLYGREMFVGA